MDSRPKDHLPGYPLRALGNDPPDLKGRLGGPDGGSFRLSVEPEPGQESVFIGSPFIASELFGRTFRNTGRTIALRSFIGLSDFSRNFRPFGKRQKNSRIKELDPILLKPS